MPKVARDTPQNMAFDIARRRQNQSPTKLRRAREAGVDVSQCSAMMRISKGSTRVLTGIDDPADWDDEEIERGRRRDINGNWQGRSPEVIPAAVVNERIKRQQSDTHRRLNELLKISVDVLEAVLTGADVDAKERLAAVKMVMDRTLGKEVQKVEVIAPAKWEVALEASITSVINLPEKKRLAVQSSTTDEVDDDDDDDGEDTDDDES